jgi:methyl-accepting chemotaxis protein
MRWLINIPIRRKLMLITVLASAIALLLAGSIIVAYDTVAYRTKQKQEIVVRAEIVATNVSASLVFNDPKAAKEYLNALSANSEIIAAGVYSASGALLTSYVRPGLQTPPLLPPQAEPRDVHFESNDLVVFLPVMEGKQQVGTVYLRAVTEPLATRLTRYGGIILLVMLISLIITVPISMRLNAVIANPIRDITEAARQIAAGEIVVRPVAEHRSDELGVLDKAFASMVENLRTMNRELGEGVSVLAASTSAILTGTTQVAAGATEAAMVMAQTVTTVEEMKQTVLVSSQKANQVSDAAQKAAQVSQAGNKSVEDVIGGMSRIQEQMESIAESIIRLSEQSQAIGEIIATVKDLAEQSNLLAVNAAIEANKAGEQGRGFSVVAQEVKNLSEQSKKATSQIRTILGEIQKGTSIAVLATEQGAKAVEIGVKQSRDAGDAIRQLTESIGENAFAASQIAVSAQQQLVGVDQLALAMENIKESTTQNMESTRQAELAAHSLHELGQKLKGMVERYKV